MDLKPGETGHFIIQSPDADDTLPIYLDFETVKIPISFTRPDTGEHMSRRWRIVAAGLTFGKERPAVMYFQGSERKLLDQVGKHFLPGRTVYYSATREFDEMLAKGRFTNARRAHLPYTIFPAVPGADDVHWVNLWKYARNTPRKPSRDDFPSKDVQKLWESGEEGRERVRRHLMADVRHLQSIVYP